MPEQRTSRPLIPKKPWFFVITSSEGILVRVRNLIRVLAVARIETAIGLEREDLWNKGGFGALFTQPRQRGDIAPMHWLKVSERFSEEKANEELQVSP